MMKPTMILAVLSLAMLGVLIDAPSPTLEWQVPDRGFALDRLPVEGHSRSQRQRPASFEHLLVRFRQ
jgi:hypothetical protein